jgi:NADPH2:quinone reductase
MPDERAIVVHETGGPDVLRIEDRDPGEPGPGEIRIRVSAAGVNFIDTYQRTGYYPRALPFVPGSEGAGVIERTGAGVADLAPGDHVAWATAPGSYATSIVARGAAVVGIPAGVADEAAAAVMLQGMTAHYLVHGLRTPAPGDVALVHAAAGGTGLLLAQTLRAAGVRVIGTCSTPEKEALARAAGSDDVIRYDVTPDFAGEVRRLTGGEGVHVVYDGVGATTFEGSLASLRVRGLMALFGAASGPVPPFDLQRLNPLGSLFVTRPTLAHYIGTREDLLMRAEAVLGAVASGTLDVRIGARFPLANASEAHRALESRATTGKVLLIP